MNLLYLSYGTGPHQQEVIFSVLSALYWSPEESDFQILIYTDHPEVFKDIPAQIQFISSDLWNEWAGLTQFNHRRKILALKHAFEAYGGPIILLDGDTWLRAPVTKLFERINAGRSLMHIREGAVAKIDSPKASQFRDLLKHAKLNGADGAPLLIPADISMYNAGVVGIDASDAGLLDQVLYLTDQLCQLSDLHVLEQFSFSYVFASNTKLSEADDLVFHYWPPYLHEPFRAELPGIMDAAKSLPIRQRVEYLYTHRPRPTWPRRAKVVLKRILQFAGIIRGRCRTNEW